MRIFLFMMLCISLHAQEGIYHPEWWQNQGDSIAVSGENHGQTISMFVQNKNIPIIVIDKINPLSLVGNVELILHILVRTEEGEIAKNKYTLRQSDKGFYTQDSRIIITKDHDLWSVIFWNLAEDIYVNGWVVGDKNIELFQLDLIMFKLTTSKIIN